MFDRVVVDAHVLRTSLAPILGLVASNHLKPILEDVLLYTDAEGRLRGAGGTPEVSADVLLRSGRAEGFPGVSVDARRLAAALRTLTGEVAIEPGPEGLGAVLLGVRTRFALGGHEPTAHPMHPSNARPAGPGPESILVPYHPAELVEAGASCATAADANASRYAFGGVLIVPDETQDLAHLVGGDGPRLIHRCVPLMDRPSAWPGGRDVVIPPRFWSAASKVLELCETPGETRLVAEGHVAVRFEVGLHRVRSSCIEGRYAPWRNIFLPDTAPIAFAVERIEDLGRLGSAVALASSTKLKERPGLLVECRPVADGSGVALSLRNRSEVGSGVVRVELPGTSGEPCRLAVDAAMLAWALKQCDVPAVARFGDRAVHLRSEGRDVLVALQSAGDLSGFPEFQKLGAVPSWAIEQGVDPSSEPTPEPTPEPEAVA